MDPFASSGTSPTFPFVVLLAIDLVAWYFLVRFLQWFTGRRAPLIAARPVTILFPIGPEDDRGNTPILLMTVEPNGNTKAERAVWHRTKREQQP